MGLEKWLPFLYPRPSAGGEEDCSVCLMRMGIRDDDVKALPCSHHFHKKCVDRWFHVSRKVCCPLCRFSPTTFDVLLLTDDLLLWFSSFHF